jgi:Ca2+-dependent lipid-binding protein
MVVRAYREKDTLRVKVYDHDHLTKNDLLGVASIPLAKYMQNEGKGKQLEVSRP